MVLQTRGSDLLGHLESCAKDNAECSQVEGAPRVSILLYRWNRKYEIYPAVSVDNISKLQTEE